MNVRPHRYKNHRAAVGENQERKLNRSEDGSGGRSKERREERSEELEAVVTRYILSNPKNNTNLRSILPRLSSNCCPNCCSSRQRQPDAERNSYRTIAVAPFSSLSPANLGGFASSQRVLRVCPLQPVLVIRPRAN